MAAGSEKPGGRVSRSALLGLVVLVLAVSAATQWWHGSRDRDIGRQVAAAARPGDIHMLSSESCAICWVARSWFTEHKVAFSECSIETDAACRRTFDDHRAPGTPVLLVRGQVLFGFDPAQLQQAMQRRG